MQQTIEIECPKCQAQLSLDAGFAGGICRCSNCGALMTVPSATHQEVEVVVRRQRPASPGAVAVPSPAPPPRPQRPDAPAAPERPQRPRPAGAPASARPAAPKRTAAPDARPGRADPPAKPTEPVATENEVLTEEQELVTESGRTIHLEAGQMIPVALKRKLLIARVGTITVVAVVVIIFTVAVIGLMTTMLGTQDEIVASERQARVDRQRVAAEQAHIMDFAFSAQVNPFNLDMPNAMGNALRESTLVLVDRSQASAPWLALVKQALEAGLLELPQTPSEVELAYLSAAGAQSLFGGELKPMSELHAQALAELHQGVTATGDPLLLPGLVAVLEQAPQQVILITGNPLEQVGEAAVWEPVLQDLKRRFEARMALQPTGAEEDTPPPAFHFHVMLIAEDDWGWEFLARTVNGQYHWYTQMQLETWAQSTASP